MDLDPGTPEAPRRPVAVARADRLVASVAAPTHPDRNEDAAFLDAAAGIGAVFDGIAGHAGGQIASGIGAAAARTSAAETPAGPEWPRRALERGRAELNAAIAREAAEAGEELRGGRVMGSTGVAVHAGPEETTVAWCGDSRAYAVYADGRVIKLTRDHGAVDTWRRSGQITEARAEELDAVLDSRDKAAVAAMGMEEALAWRFRDIVEGHLGAGPIDEVRVPSAGLLAVVLTSDGVHDNLTTAQVEATVAEAVRSGGVAAIAGALVVAAAAVMGSGQGRAKPDDVTAVTVPVPGVAPGA